MLVIAGKLHPRFIKDSTSRHIRNGVGTSPDGTRAVFAISRQAVNFHDFACLFRDELKTPNALYFDGSVSRLHAPQIHRSDPGRQLGPIVGVVVDRNCPPQTFLFFSFPKYLSDIIIGASRPHLPGDRMHIALSLQRHRQFGHSKTPSTAANAASG